MSTLSRRPMPSIPSHRALAMSSLAKRRGTVTHMLPGYHPLQAARGGDRYAPWNLSYSWSAAIQMPLFQVSSSRVRVRVRVSTSLPEHASYPTPPTSHCLPYYYLTTTLLLPYYYLTTTLLLPYCYLTTTLPRTYPNSSSCATTRPSSGTRPPTCPSRPWPRTTSPTSRSPPQRPLGRCRF